MSGFGTFDAARIKRISDEITRQRAARKDYVVTRARLGVTTGDDDTGLSLLVQNGAPEPHVLPIERHALSQLSDVTRTPLRFLDRLTEAGHWDLAATTLSEILTREEAAKKHLVRTLDGKADAFLSDRYRSISNDAVANVAFEELERVGAKVWDLRLSPTEFRLLAAAPHIHGQVTTDRNFKGASRWEGKAGDVINAALTLKNSETGHASFAGLPAILRRICQNFCIHGDGVSTVHLGGRLAEGEQFKSDQTRELEGKALASGLRDVIRTTFDPVKFKATLDAINATTQRDLGEATPTQVVDASVELFGINPGRRDAILEELLQSGDKTQYGLVNAVTAQVNPEHAGDLDDATRSAFEDVGGKILAIGALDWKAFIKRAVAPVEPERELVVARRG
jgi:hypothetical protein